MKGALIKSFDNDVGNTTETSKKIVSSDSNDRLGDFFSIIFVAKLN